MACVFGSKTQQLYKCSLVILNILALSLYQESHVLLFANTLSAEVDIDWHKYVSLSDIGNTRAQTTRIFQSLNFRFNKKRIRFFGYESVILPINLTISQFLFKEDCKNKLLDLYFLYFHNKYENMSCTWRIVCGCTKCKEVKKLFKNFS